MQIMKCKLCGEDMQVFFYPTHQTPIVESTGLPSEDKFFALHLACESIGCVARNPHNIVNACTPYYCGSTSEVPHAHRINLAPLVAALETSYKNLTTKEARWGVD